MDIHHLHIFTAVYRTRSFTKAAREIHICQPTVSEHIKNLEQELECRLFDRLGKAVAPTAAADLLFPKALQILESVFQVKEELRGGEDAVTGEIVLGASTIPGTYILPPIIMRFRERYPGITFTVTIKDSAKITEMVRRHELLVGIVGARTDDNALLYDQVFQDHLVLVTSPSPGRGKTITSEGLSRLPFVLGEKGSGTRQAMEEHFARLGFALSREQVVAEFSSTAAIKEAARCGLGAAVISHLAVREEIGQGNLHEIVWQKQRMQRDFYFLNHQRRTLPPLYRRFRQFLAETQSAGIPG